MDDSRKYFAAIDLGTNSCRMLIVDDKGETVYRNADTVKLGEGMSEHNMFTDAAMQRALFCLYKYKQEMNKYDISGFRAIATEACRRAGNGSEFLKKVYHETQIKLEVIDGFEEARLNLKGAISHVLGKSKYVAVFDIGGGSTEISLAENNPQAKILYSLSIPLGSRNSCEIFGLENYDEKRVAELSQKIAKYTKLFVDESGYSKFKDETMVVATSSTPLRLVSMVKKHGSYDRLTADGKKVSKEELSEQFDKIYKMSLNERKDSPYLGANRGPIFISSVTIFKTICDALDAKEVTASLRAAQEAIVEELMDNGKTNKICQRDLRKAQSYC